MKNRVKAGRFFLITGLAFVLTAGFGGKAYAQGMEAAALIEMEPALHKPEEKKITPKKLYSLSAVLMDGDSGRILYEKEGEVPRPNASTTKVLTCILALENAPGDDYVSISAKAAAQPDVQLNLREGEQYYLEDLLYSLMLQSHNDTAVAIAEHIGGSVEEFAGMMNRKAKEIGCTDTYFITPNGLDAKDGKGTHHTTARDLAKIMRYAVGNETFLKITETRTYSFSDLKGQRQFSLQNTNAFLDMTPGLLSGKTGFTGDAGYCYVCAWEKDGKTLIVSLLGCGWPNNKTYKWKDAAALLEYGDRNFQYRTYWKEPKFSPMLVADGVGAKMHTPVYLKGQCSVSGKEKERKLLLGKEEEISVRVSLPKILRAPVKKGEKIGQVAYYLGDQVLCRYPVLAEKTVRERDYRWCVEQVFDLFFH